MTPTDLIEQARQRWCKPDGYMTGGSDDDCPPEVVAALLDYLEHGAEPGAHKYWIGAIGLIEEHLK